MTEEEIIIDGVNVAGCEFYQIEANELYPKAQYCGSMRNTFCENEPNCYYKQLKRLEQENKELKENLKSQEMINLKQQENALDYWNALEEIKNILDKECSIVSNAKAVGIINEVLN